MVEQKNMIPYPDSYRDGRAKKYDSVAQLVEQYTFNVWVLGSNPSGITKTSNFGGFFVLDKICFG
jgi:hypothetical protein